MTNFATTLPAPLATGEGGLKRYLQAIRAFPVLSADEEFMLAQRWHKEGDLEAAHKLVTSHLRLVAKIAMGFRHYGLPVADLISEGNIGLMRAVKKFEPDRGFRLATYAMWWIKASITEFVLQSWSLVRLGTAAAQKRLFFNLRRLKSDLGAIDGQPLTFEQTKAIATRLDVPEAEVQAMERRLYARDVSLNMPASAESEVERQDLLVDVAPDQETRFIEHEESRRGNAFIAQALTELDARERRIFEARRLQDEPATLEDLAKIFGISRERVRQIENKAFEKVSRAVKRQAGP